MFLTGLDVKDVQVVIYYDMPAGMNAVEDNVHRIVRTCRAGAKGRAFTFFTSGDRTRITCHVSPTIGVRLVVVDVAVTEDEVAEVTWELGGFRSTTRG